MSVVASGPAAKPGEIATEDAEGPPGRDGGLRHAEGMIERRKASIAAACAELAVALESLPLWGARGGAGL